MGKLSTRKSTYRFRAIAAALLTAVLAVGAPAANADELQPGYPKLGQDSELVYGHDLYRDGALGTQLLTVHTNDKGGKILAYCIELDVHSEWGGEMKQASWSAFPGSNEFAKNPQVRSKISWIAHRSYPQVSITQVATEAGVPGLTEREAITATQAAIWHLTDNFTFNGLHSWEEPRHDTTSDRAQRVTKLYNYLLGSANTGLPETSGPKVEVAVPRTPGASGELVGPIRLTATQQTVAVAALPHPLVDATGKEVDLAAVPTGTDLFLKVPADAPAGKANIVANLTGDAHTDQLLVARNGRWQTLIMVKTQQVTATGQGEVSWAPVQAPSPSPSPSESPTPTPSETPSPAPTPSPTPSDSPSPSPTPTPSDSPSPSPTPTPTPTASTSTPSPVPSTTAPSARPSHPVTKPGLPKTGH